MAPWVKTAKSIKTDGSKTIRYESFRNPNVIESRRVPTPHASGMGFWYYTVYFLIRPDGTEKEFRTLTDAKKAAEKEGES